MDKTKVLMWTYADLMNVTFNEWTMDTNFKN